MDPLTEPVEPDRVAAQRLWDEFRAGLVSDFTAAGEPLPAVGGHWIAVDGTGAPRCVLRTTEIRLGLLGSVDDAFARDEGEGDRSRDWWLAAHRRFFLRQAERTGTPFDETGEQVVFERFAVVWPLDGG